MDAFAIIRKIVRIYIYMLIFAWIVLSITFWMMIRQTNDQVIKQSIDQTMNQPLSGPHKAHDQMINGINRIESSFNHSVDGAAEIMHSIAHALPLSQSVTETVDQSIKYWNTQVKGLITEIFEVARYAADEWLEEATNQAANQPNKQTINQKASKSMHNPPPGVRPLPGHSAVQAKEEKPTHIKPITELTRITIPRIVPDPSAHKPGVHTIQHQEACLYISPLPSSDPAIKPSVIQSLPDGRDNEMRVILSVADGLIRVTHKTPRAA